MKKIEDLDKNIELLGNYAAFLEETLEDNGYKLSENGVMEVVDSSFNATSEYIGRGNYNGTCRREDLLVLRIVTENILDDFLQNPDGIKNVNIVYSQMPFNKPNNLIHKLSLVPVLTPAVAIFGAYGLKKDRYERVESFNVLRKYTSSLINNGLDYEHFFKQNSDSYFELIISRNKELLYKKI